MRRLPPSLRKLLIISVLVATVLVFVLFFRNHPEVGHQLRHISPWLIVGLVLLYIGATACVGLVLKATLTLCRVKIPVRESLLVTMYSAIVNFFGPLQSGPAFRAIYLKRRHKVELKKYTLATLAYYAFYGGISLVLLFSSIFKWWLVPACLLGGGLLYLLYRGKVGIARRFQSLNLAALGYLGLATLLQALFSVVIFYVELHSLDSHVHLSQAVTYAGAANLALFVSITPGAIGFRESFLVFSKHLHHISDNHIVAANVIDRSVYIITLLILLVCIVATHAERRLRSVETE
jgi:uncharacterized membrane protein YbhN (UPF0104 family)